MIQKNRYCTKLLALFSSFACLGGAVNDIPITEGTIPFTYQGETYQTYYKVVGDLATVDGSNTPLVVLHGGPGLSHDYLLPISDLAIKASIPIVFYDQIGNARSTHLRDKPSSFWTIDLFVDELANLISSLSVQNSFALLGHSWGGVLGAEFEVRRQPEGLRYLILSDSLAASDLWSQSTAMLARSFPKAVQEGLAAGMTNMEEFRPALAQFNAVHGCTVKPVPKEMTYSFNQIFGPNGDPTVARADILQNWTIIDRLDLVRTSTLVINGRNDIAQDFVVAPFYQNIAEVKWITFEQSSHTPFWEERDRYMQVVSSFLRP
ncbi:proline iminopeptidase [Sparassis latifolia]|uniref:Proline iminopeptidase n=1 Tax=Sparassis crispa TaxID=139825 RepID=A0A401H498_9APHY|nr:proline iminopeptidase [Sparassis crispa]GBE89265.1 proline iminopeptidase [Sparassis crispa]